MRKFLLSCFVPFLLIATSAWAQSSAVLNGNVRDVTSAPIARVSVTLSSLDRVLQEKTGEDGEFRFAIVPPGAYELGLTAEGFLNKNLALTLASGDSRSLKILLAVAPVPDMNYCGPHPLIHYDPPNSNGRRVEGIVRDYLDSKPIPKAEIILLRAGEKRPVAVSTADSAGKFKFIDPPAGRYTLRVSRSGYRQTDLKQFLIPRENGTFVDFPILKRKTMIVCE